MKSIQQLPTIAVVSQVSIHKVNEFYLDCTSHAFLSRSCFIYKQTRECMCMYIYTYICILIAKMYI